MKKILIIGGGGYVGSVLNYSLLKSGFSTVIFDFFIYKNESVVLPFINDNRCQIITGNIVNKKDLDLIPKDITDVIILAGLVGDPITKAYPIESELINNQGIKNCIDYFADSNINKLIFVSTCSNYGMIKDGEVADEEFELNPLSLYAKSKVSSEQYLLSKKGKTSYTGVILRFATAFGLSPRMRFDLTISEFTKALYFKDILKVFDENTWRPYCHVQDFARLLEIVLNQKNPDVNFEIFNAGGDNNNFTKKMVIDIIKNYIPEAKVDYVQKGSDPRNYKVSFEKVKSILSFEPNYSINDGVKELINAFELGLFNNVNENINFFGNYNLEKNAK